MGRQGQNWGWTLWWTVWDNRRYQEDTRKRRSFTRGPWPGSCCHLVWGSHQIFRDACSPPDAASCLQSHRLSFSNSPPSQRPMIWLEPKFGHHSFALSEIHCLHHKAKPKFLSVAGMAFHDLCFNLFLVAAPWSLTFYVSLLTTPLDLPSSRQTCFPSIWSPFPHISLDTLFPV